jgi:KaiC/GvpD/RAD55 family RecA-like ATPase
MASNTGNIKENLEKNEIIGLVIPDIEYDEMLIRLAGAVSEYYDKTLYISINKPCESLAGRFRKSGIDAGKFMFIDCITRTTKPAQSTKNCIYVSSPKALHEIQEAIIEAVNKNRIDVAIIDSPSSLLMYYEHMDVLKFLHLLMAKLIISNCKGILPFQKESSGSLRRSVEMFTDATVSLDKISL